MQHAHTHTNTYPDAQYEDEKQTICKQSHMLNKVV